MSDGRIAGYVIYATVASGSAAGERAAALGPGEVLAPAPPAELTRRAGFTGVTVDDVTAPFRTTCEAMLTAAARWEADLRAEEGDAAYDEGIERGRAMLTGIDEGLLRRALVVGVKP